ncbi:ATP-binding protein [Sphingomonas oligophenolica]|uniref:histidine kinase n=1 Tax=Sphingomonas oligophenolica TaxID=301154 RepID=A0A502BYG9_9SPHN|nr:ATP-binding protein [Sphingomonas oligophenolica]TPG04731.1 HAMP domain-containing protein [Sphingomonas oligophenolica]
MVIEFGASTLLYERASQFSVRDDEARRLAEHLVIARRLIAEQQPAGRSTMALELTTQRYAVEWREALPPPPATVPALLSMREQIVDWEPTLASSRLRLTLTAPGRSSVVTGGLALDDGSWLYFHTLTPLDNLSLSGARVAVALLPALLLMVLGGLLIRRALRPMRQLAIAANRVGQGDAVIVEQAGPAEVRRVIVAFNRMQARIERLIADRTQALAAVGHDLRTPLARLRLRSEEVREPATRDAITRDVAEMEAMVESLLAFLGGGSNPEPPVRCDVAVLCATVVDDLEDHGVVARYEGPDHCEVVTRPAALRRALGNLVDNAIHYAGSATIRLTPLPGSYTIAVLDEGPGIPDDALASVVEPFVRLDTARARDTVGFGLGLAVVARIVEDEGGTLVLANRVEGGLAAAITLPVGGIGAA